VLGARLARLLLGENLMVQADGTGFSISEFTNEGAAMKGSSSRRELHEEEAPPRLRRRLPLAVFSAR